MRWSRRLAPAAALPLLVGLCAAASAQARGARTVPAGTPYAAEVKLVIEGEAHLAAAYSHTEDNVCDTQSQKDSQMDSFGLKLKVVYPQVTVPVAGPKELGRAYGKLHVKPTPTAPGRAIASRGAYSIFGDGPSSNDTCDSVEFNNNGDLSAHRPTFIQGSIDQGRDDGFDFLLAPELSADPADWASSFGGRTIDVMNQEQVDENLVPADRKLAESSPGAALAGMADIQLLDDVEAFRPLLTSPQHAIQAYAKYSGEKDCAQPGEPGVETSTCTVDWDWGYDITFHLLHVYKTRRAYPK